MPKPTTPLDTKAPDVPFYFVRVPPSLLGDVEAKRLELGYNKRKSVEVMANLFLTLKAGDTASPIFGRVSRAKKKKPTKSTKK